MMLVFIIAILLTLSVADYSVLTVVNTFDLYNLFTFLIFYIHVIFCYMHNIILFFWKHIVRIV